MLELKQVTVSKEKINGCTVESTSVKTVNVKTKGQERTFQKRYLQSVYHLDSMYINVKHENGRNGRIDVYALAFYCVFKTLRKATTKRAIELFDNKFSYCVHDWQDMIMTGVDYMLFGYVDGNGKYHKGYYTDKISNVKELTGVIFSAVNHVIYAKGVTGKWTGKEVLTDNFAIVKDVTNIFGYVNNCNSVNAKKYDMFIFNVKRFLDRQSDIELLDAIAYNNKNTVGTDGSILYNNLSSIFDVSRMTINRGVKRIKIAITDTIAKYNMTETQFVEYLQA